jgi:hypothetical protein
LHYLSSLKGQFTLNYRLGNKNRNEKRALEVKGFSDHLVVCLKERKNRSRPIQERPKEKVVEEEAALLLPLRRDLAR